MAARNSRDWAKFYVKQFGWTVNPMLPMSKETRFPWSKKDATPADFKTNSNIAVITGPRSGHLTDLDLDSPEGRELAHHVFFEECPTFGRESARGS